MRGCPLPLPGWITWTVAAAGSCALAGLALLPLLPRLRPWLAGSARLVRLVDGALIYLRHPRAVAAATALSVLVQAAGVVTVWLIGRALGLPVPLLYYGILVPLVALLTMLPVSLNGMGLHPHGTPAPTPCSGSALEHAGAGLTARGGGDQRRGCGCGRRRQSGRGAVRF